MFHHVSDATEPLHFTQPARVLKFYNFVCCIERNHRERKNKLTDDKEDREIISFYVRYHHLLSRNQTTDSNALIGAWQKGLGHQSLWEDFNLEYAHGPAPLTVTSPVPSRPTRASTRKSTGCISASKPRKMSTHLSRRRSAGYRYPSDSSLTPLSSSDDEGDAPSITPTKRSRIGSPPQSISVMLDSATEPRMKRLNDRSFGGVDQGISDNCPPRESHMHSGGEPPATPPQNTHALIGLGDFCAGDDIHGSTYDPVNGTSISAACLQPERGPTQLGTLSTLPKSLSAPVPPSSFRAGEKRKKTFNYHTKKKSPKKKAEPVEGTTHEPMAIDIPTVPSPEVRPGPATTTLSEPFRLRIEPPEPPPLKISIHPVTSIPSVSPEVKLPLSTACINLPSPRSTQGRNPDLSLASPKGLGGITAVTTPGFSRPPLPNNPPIWAQVRVPLR